MHDLDKEIFERLARLETNRTNDQEAIRLLREQKKDSTATYIALAAAIAGILGLVLAGIGLVLQLMRH
jgi:hypothetical protein